MKRQLFFSGLSLLLLFNSCGPTRGKSSSAKSSTTKKIIQFHKDASFSKNSVQAKIKASFENSKTTQTLQVKLRIKKDEIIWMSGSFLGFPVAKVKITPNKVQYYEKVTQTYFDGDFSLLSQALGTELSFIQLQNILLGQSIFDLDEKEHKSQTDNQYYLLTPQEQEDLYAIFYWINPISYKIEKQELKDNNSGNFLSISYPKYQLISNIYYPQEIDILAIDTIETTSINLQFRSIEFNKNTSYPFQIPEGYTPIKID